MDVRDDRLPLPDPAASRRSARRSVLLGVLLFVGLTGFTASGTAMVAAGELPGLPFAIGGALAQLAIVVLVATILYDRASGHGMSLSRARLAQTNRILAALRWLLLAALVALGLYALTRLVLGDPWTLLTSGIVGVFLWILYRGTVRIRRGRRTQP